MIDPLSSMAAARRGKFAPDAVPQPWHSPVMRRSRAATPPVPDVRVGRSRGMSERVVAFSRYVRTCTSRRPRKVNDAELKEAEEEMARLLREVVE